jgi:hypothetical protein
MCFQCLCPTSPVGVYCIYSHQVTVSLFASTINTVWQFGIISYFVHWATIGSSPAHKVTTHQFLASPFGPCYYCSTSICIEPHQCVHGWFYFSGVGEPLMLTNGPMHSHACCGQSFLHTIAIWRPPT